MDINILYGARCMFGAWQRHMLISLYLEEQKYTKMHQKVIMSISLNALQLFCMSLYVDCLVVGLSPIVTRQWLRGNAQN